MDELSNSCYSRLTGPLSAVEGEKVCKMQPGRHIALISKPELTTVFNQYGSGAWIVYLGYNLPSIGPDCTAISSNGEYSEKPCSSPLDVICEATTLSTPEEATTTQIATTTYAATTEESTTIIISPTTDALTTEVVTTSHTATTPESITSDEATATHITTTSDAMPPQNMSTDMSASTSYATPAEEPTTIAISSPSVTTSVGQTTSSAIGADGTSYSFTVMFSLVSTEGSIKNLNVLTSYRDVRTVVRCAIKCRSLANCNALTYSSINGRCSLGGIGSTGDLENKSDCATYVITNGS